MKRQRRAQGNSRRTGAPRIEEGIAAGRTCRRGRMRVDAGQAWRLKTSVPFVPPNPNEFFSAMSIFMSRAVFAQ